MNTKTERTRVKRSHERGAYDRDTIDAILDAMPLAHVGHIRDGTPFVTPTLQWRDGDYVYWHGSSASTAIRKSRTAPVCLTVSTFDGLVLARSGFHHSANYRSVMLLGEAEQIVGAEEKSAALEAMFNRWMPGRWQRLREMTAQEVKATGVLRLKIEEGSAKIRTGQPVDDAEDYALPIWAGVLPISLQFGELIPDPRNLEGVPVPKHLASIDFG